jgi:hypothetical protein
MLERGILIVVYGHPYYGRMAYNLACTIKSVERTCEIAVAYNGRALNHLGDDQKAIFDHIIEIPIEWGGGYAPKLYLNELTPFKHTLFLDADMAWIPYRTPAEFFDKFAEVDYTGITEGWFDVEPRDDSHTNKAYYYWADLNEICEVYKITTGRIYQWRSEVVYFKKCKRVDKFFEKARRIHKNPKLKTIRQFGEAVPDELCINIAANLCGIEPHQPRWTPAYWHRLHNNRVPTVAELQQWFAVGFGGNYAGGGLIKLYDQLTSVAMRKLGRQHVFSLHPKKNFLVERNKM